MAKVKLSNRKGWVRLKPAHISDFAKEEEFVVKYKNQYLIASMPTYYNKLIVAKYRRDLVLSPKEVLVFRII